MGRTCQDQMDCDTVSLLLPLYFDGILHLKEHEQVRSHLAQCLSCRRLTLVEQNPLQTLPNIPPDLMMQFAEEFDASLAEALRDPALGRNAPTFGTGRGRRAGNRMRSPYRPLGPRFWDIHRTSLTWFSGLIVGATTSWAAVMWWKGPASTPGLEALRMSSVPQQRQQPGATTLVPLEKTLPPSTESSAMTLQVSPSSRRRYSDAQPLPSTETDDRVHLLDVSGDLSTLRLDAAIPWMTTGPIPLGGGTELFPVSTLDSEHLLYSHLSAGQLY